MTNKNLVKEGFWIDMSYLKRLGYLNQDYMSGVLSWTNKSRGKNNIRIIVNLLDKNNMFLNLDYIISKNTGEKNKMNYDIPIVRTKCNFGGYRYWFKCILYKNRIYCGKRVRVVYLDIGDYFCCRNCNNLTYECKTESYNSGKSPNFRRLLDTLNKIEEIEEKMKVRFYNGKPTRKMRQYIKLNNKLGIYTESNLNKSI